MYYNSNTKYKRCTILLKEDIYKRLKTKGKFGESFSELISRLLDEIDFLETNKKRVKYNGNSE
jgi:predicted CopG family antitoxin